MIHSTQYEPIAKAVPLYGLSLRSEKESQTRFVFRMVVNLEVFSLVLHDPQRLSVLGHTPLKYVLTPCKNERSWIEIDLVYLPCAQSAQTAETPL